MGLDANKNWLVVSTPLKNMKVDDYSQYMEIQKSHVPATTNQMGLDANKKDGQYSGQITILH